MPDEPNSGAEDFSFAAQPDVGTDETQILGPSRQKRRPIKNADPSVDDSFQTPNELVKAFDEKQKLEAAVRDARPSILDIRRPFGGPLLASQRTEDEVRRIDFPVGSVQRQPRQPFFPEEIPAGTTTVATAKAFPDIAFLLSDGTTTVMGVTTHKIHVFDGKINGVFPSGMGFGNYVLTPADPNDAIVIAGVTFNPTTLAETSRFLEVDKAADVPESRVESDTLGFLYWQIGFASLDGAMFKIVNTWAGDINFAFTYGKLNGKPALLPVHSNPGWIDLDAIFP